MFSMKSLQQYKWNQTDINIYISSYLEFSVVAPKSRHTEKFSYNNILIQIQYFFDKVKYWLINTSITKYTALMLKLEYYVLKYKEYPK